MAKKKLHIAIFSGELPSTTFIEHLIDGVSSKHCVLLFGVKKNSENMSYKGDVKVYVTSQNKFWNLYLSFYRSLRLLLKQPKDLILLWQEIKQYKTRYDRWVWFTKFLPILTYKPDVLHLQWTRDVEFYTFFKTKFNIPLIVSLRGAHVNYTPIILPRIAEVYKKSFPEVDAFHAVSEAIRVEARKYNDIAKCTRVIHSPIPNSFFRAFSSLKKTTNEIDFHVVSVGRLHWIKGYVYAIKAIAILNSLGYKVKYTIIGNSHANEELLFLINDLELHEVVHFKSELGQIELIHFLKSQDVFLLSSVEEGIANVVLEAMAIGIPVVSTDCGGMSEVVKHKETGWLVPARNPNAMADAIVEIVESDEASINRVTQEAHRLVKDQFNYDTSIQEFISLYESVVESRT